MDANLDTNFMGIDPRDIFVTNEAPARESNVFNANPVKFSKSDDKHYHAKLRIVYNPHNLKKSIIHNVKYVMTDANGLFFADSVLSFGFEHKNECPLFTGWKQLHFSGDPKKDEWSKQMFEKRETDWATVQIIEDENRPDLVGKFMQMKLPKAILTKLKDKMDPTPESKRQPVAMMDYLFGPVLELNVIPGPAGNEQRQISYDLCDFDTDPHPIIKTDGTQLFTDEELELIDNYATISAAIVKAKSEKARNEKQAEKDTITPQVKELWVKATEYMKENCIDIEKEAGYKQWSPELEARVKRWLDAVLNMRDPQIPTVTSDTPAPTLTFNESSPEDDMPF